MDSEVQVSNMFDVKLLEERLEPIANAADCTPEEFTLLRKQGLGASDASVLLGLQNKWRTRDDLIAEKKRNYITAEEKEVGRKPAVVKGRDLEPLVLHKAEEFFGCEICKPPMMYRFKASPWLTINFDGVLIDTKQTLTVAEAKVVTTFGDKYYNKDAALTNLNELDLTIHRITSKSFLAQDIQTKAKVCGVPDYYYAQVQQQLLGIDAPYGYLTALHDKDWKLRVYVIPADAEVQAKIITLGHNAWSEIKGVH